MHKITTGILTIVIVAGMGAFAWKACATDEPAQQAAPATPAALGSDAGLGPGDEGESVAALQRALRDYGYGVEVTTTYGTGLENAVEAFQRHFRQARVDGRADASTRDTLERLLTAQSQAAIA